MTYSPNFVAGAILHAADLNGAFNAVEGDISANTTAIAAVQVTASAANAAASAASAAAAAAQATANAAVPSSALGVTVATLTGGSLPVSQLPTSGIVTSINGKSGAVTSSPADYQLARDISTPKPVLSSFTQTVASTANAQLAAATTDLGDALLVTNLANVATSASTGLTAYGMFKPVKAIDAITMVVEPDEFYVLNAGQSSVYGPHIGIGLLLSSSSAGPSTKIYCANGVYGRSSGGLWAAVTGQAQSYASSSSNPADMTSGSLNSGISIPLYQRIWLKVTGIQSGSLVFSASVNGRNWYPAGTATVTASTVLAVGFYGMCPYGSAKIPNYAQLVGWGQADSSGNAITAY
ncbi:hypothetical protein FHR90_003279 [Endobacter medicaginis]|uniref:Uncharacterized protein n=1 Tax=Endobacter medicaginis TaxID=1181271 RepID=A0A850NNK7_9PROT|nr:hypothetical protein [Endobacter medicaginis]MBB3175424.1 hypothetical protein [Endobacter medicaginis]MCX5476869.1 hypothetical protein [Endobacter medicaginis]NVN29610.1 hypothetical protein [Endobacter medicaginis]